MGLAKLFISLAAASGMLGVMAGAFGAHALQDRLESRMLQVFDTAVQYQMYHSLALLGVGLLALQVPDLPLLKNAGWLFVLGILIFSGSLYVLALTGQRALGMVTPLGGLAFIAGWACLAFAAWQLAR